MLSSQSESSLGQVDQLLSHVESVEVESAVAKERAHAALETLQVLVRPDFGGDAAQTYAAFLEQIEASETQGAALAGSLTPLQESAEALFERWTRDLEAIGNTRLRAQSHLRLQETRARYEAVRSAANTATVAFDAYNADLRDHALFLGHDYNQAAIGVIASEVQSLAERARDLDQRLDACDAAARRYVESAALHGQLANPPAAAGAPRTESTATRRRVETLAPRADGEQAPAAPPAPGDALPQPH